VVELLPSKHEVLNSNPNTTKKKKNTLFSQVPVAHAYNPSYSGGRDLEDRGLKPAQSNSSQDLISKNPSQKKAGGVA
jgi:hypothetical protein